MAGNSKRVTPKWARSRARNAVVRVRQVDMSAMSFILIAARGAPPFAGSFVDLRVEHVLSHEDGRRMMRLRGSIRAIVNCLRLLGRCDEASSLLAAYGLPDSVARDGAQA